MRIFFLGILISCSFFGQAQNIRLHLMAGRANYTGELQPQSFTFNQSNLAYGAGASIDLSNRIVLRAEYLSTKLGADDKFSDRRGYRTRNLNFKTDIREFNLAAEYNLRNSDEHKLVPYIFGGLGLFKFNPYTTDSVHGKQFLSVLSTEGQGLPEYPGRKPYKTTQLNIPFGGGVKYFLSEDVNFSFELGIRGLFTDYLDDVSTTYVDEATLLNARGPVAVALAFRGDELKDNPQQYPRAGAQRGSPKAKDYYYYGLAKIGIRINSASNGGSQGGRRGKFGCPSSVL